MISWFSQGIGADKFEVVMPPKGPSGQFAYFGQDGYCVSALSKNKDAAWEFISWLLTSDVNAETSKGPARCRRSSTPTARSTSRRPT